MRIVEPYAKMVSTYPDGRAIITQIATAARTSHNSESSGYEADLELVRKLIGWGHLSCLEHAVLSADIRTDRGVTHELVRHRLASYVQESTRYVDYADGIEIVLPREVENVKEHVAGFDVDEHIEMWIMAKRSGTQGVPSARELVHDAEDIDKMLQELAAALEATNEA